MYVEVGWPVRSTQLSNIVLTLQASLENQSLTQGYTVCCRKRLTPGYVCYALTGLMNAMSRFMLIVLPKTKQNIIWILSTLPYGGKFIENNKRKGKPLRYICRPYGTCLLQSFYRMAVKINVSAFFEKLP